MSQANDPRRRIPSVDKVLQQLNTLPDVDRYSHGQRIGAIHDVLDRIRCEDCRSSIPTVQEIAEEARLALESLGQSGLRRVVNATGVVLHTNLGRAVLPREAMEAVAQLEGCCSLQIDLETGERGRRETAIETTLQSITGAEAATVVGNNAGATLIVLAALCQGREVIVSRGQLIEIGGSFRLPDVIAESGARMVEVGTTNKTHLRDYERAITEDTAVLLRVNPSNYRIVGFAQQVATAELATLKKGRDLILVDDLGCGALMDLAELGLPHEPTVQECLRSGADVVLFSGDKLIGGPQAGIIVGRKACIDRIRRHPLARALRVGKFTIAALEATLKLFLHPETLIERNPTLRMLALKVEQLEPRAKALAERLIPLVPCEVIRGHSACGGGALPDTPIDSVVVAVRPASISAADLARRLRLGRPSVVTRVQNDAVCLDVRTLLDGEEDEVVKAFQNAIPSESKQR